MDTRNRFLRRSLAATVLLLTVGLVLASCGAPSSQGGASASPAQVGKTAQPASAVASASAAGASGAAAPPAAVPGKLVIWAPGDNGTVKDWHTDPILKVVEEKTGTSIEMVKVSSTTYQDQVNAAIASGQAPDIISCIDQNNHQLIDQWVRDGVVAQFDGGPLESKLPNILGQLNQMPWKGELKINGHFYADPVNWETQPWWGSVIHVRKDLLDKYGMQPPDTFEQYFAFLRKAKQDGQTGVIFSASGGLGGILDSFVGAYGMPGNGWVKKGNVWEYWATQPATKQGLLLFRKMVAEDLVDPVSWELQESPRDKYVAGEGASMIWNGGGHTGRIQNDMTLAGKGAKEWTIPAPNAGAGSRGYVGAPAFYCETFIGNLKGNNPEAAAKVLDFLQSDEGIKLTVLGIPGKDYQGDGANIKLLSQRTQDNFPAEAGDTGSHPLATSIVSWIPQTWQDWQVLHGKDQTFKDWYGQMLANQKKYLLPSQGTLTTSPQWTSFGSTSTELINRAFLQIVKAKDDNEAGALFDKFVQDWKGAGGDAASAEMSEVLNKIYH